MDIVETQMIPYLQDSLMQELEVVQNSDVTHKLSERSVVEIINKLLKKGLIDVIKLLLTHWSHFLVHDPEFESI